MEDIDILVMIYSRTGLTLVAALSFVIFCNLLNVSSTERRSLFRGRGSLIENEADLIDLFQPRQRGVFMDAAQVKRDREDPLNLQPSGFFNCSRNARRAARQMNFSLGISSSISL